jgi:hypothetical protein
MRYQLKSRSVIVDSLTVDRGRRAGFAFLHKMLQYVSQNAALLRSPLIIIATPGWEEPRAT